MNTTSMGLRVSNGSGAPAGIKEIPYDYVSNFRLSGRPGNRLQEVVNISSESMFIASSIGYSLAPAFRPSTPAYDAIVAAFDARKLDGLGRLLFGNAAPTAPDEHASLDAGQSLFRLALRLVGFDFKYSIIDTGSGRELQNLAIHNVAGLGEPRGRRPFRPFAKPMVFAPRSTIRIEIEEITAGAQVFGQSELCLVLHGYKVLV